MSDKRAPASEQPSGESPSLAKLESLSKAALAKDGLPNLTAPEKLNKQLAQVAKESPQKILLLDFSSLSSAQATEVGKFAGEAIILSQLASVDAASAEELANFSGAMLFLPGVKQIDAGTAKALAGWKGEHLLLNGLTAVSTEVARALATFTGMTLGVGAAKMNPDAVVAFKKFSGFLSISMSPPRERPKMDPAMRQKLVVAVRAIDGSDVAGLTAFLDGGNSPDLHERGTSLLMYAADKKKPDMVKLLIAKGADVNAKNSDGNGALYHAMKKPVLPNAPKSDPKVVADIVKALVGGGASVKASPSSSFMYKAPLALAAEFGSVELLDLFLSKGANADTALIAAINSGHAEIVSKLVAAGAEVKVSNPKPGKSPIHRAVRAGANEISMFIYSGTRPGKKLDKRRLRQIETARVAVLKAVLAAGADIEAPDDRGDTPLRAAINGGAEPILEVVLDAKPKLDQVGADGNAPLHYLASLGRLEEPDLVPLAKLVIARGADTKAVNKAGKTPAELADARGFKKLAKALR